MHCMWYWSFHSSKSAIFNIQILGNFGKSTQTWWMVWNNWCYVGYKLYCHPKEERLCESVQEPVYWKRSGSNLLSLAFRVHLAAAAVAAADAGVNENSNPPLVVKLLLTLAREAILKCSLLLPNGLGLTVKDSVICCQEDSKNWLHSKWSVYERKLPSVRTVRGLVWKAIHGVRWKQT